MSCGTMTAVSSLQLVRREQRGSGCLEIIEEFWELGREYQRRVTEARLPI